MMSDHPSTRQQTAAVTAMVPCYNEEACIERAYLTIRTELERFDDAEILFVDDGSSDQTLELIKSFAAADDRVKYISFTRNFGLEAAFTAGFKYASKDWTVQLDADLQSPPNEMHRLVAKALEGYDLVFGIRADRKDPWFRKAGSRSQQWIAQKLLAIPLPMRASVFRAVRTSVAKKIVGARMTSPYFIATAPLIGARYTAIPTAHHPRTAGSAKWNMLKLISHSMDLWIGYSVRPLAIVHLSAFVFAMSIAALVGLAGFGIVTAHWLTWVGLVLSSATFLGVGVLTRYLIPRLRVRNELPQFLIKESNIPIAPADDLYEHERQAVASTEYRPYEHI
ncbi:glycosyltransferase involved in cell wall biosynthesis [Stackebrandtia endophytica]|uniref:Glycosyltransferase involved in cell wall biosynthesis n=2 Tax=Stackebrandtia endophytica TaxID=1496996 RepID=A0A543AT21_9ACTN|nr:glycosyltransferase involved in cell wall biosynthesis [Stackebrandtia endophytica]